MAGKYKDLPECEPDWKVGTRFYSSSGEEEFPPVYSGDEDTKEADITDWCISYVALIPKDIAA